MILGVRQGGPESPTLQSIHGLCYALGKKRLNYHIHAFFISISNFFPSLGVAYVFANLSLRCCLSVAYMGQELIKKSIVFRTMHLVPTVPPFEHDGNLQAWSLHPPCSNKKL